MRVPVVLACSLLLVGLVGTGTTAAVLDDDALEPETQEIIQTIEFHVQEDGSATVVVTQQFLLDTPAKSDGFDQLAAEFEAGQHDIGGDPIMAAIPAVDETVDRQLTVQDEGRTASVDEDRGVLERELTIVNFATVEADGERILVGDAFDLDEETWIGSIGADTYLIVYTPDGYLIESATHEVHDGAIVWEGPETFEAGDIQATYERSDLPFAIDPVTLVVGGVVLLGVALASIIAWRRLEREDLPGVSGEGDKNQVPEPPGNERAAPADSEEETLISDEERVLQLLEHNEGRMKQSDIVTETGWSHAKVSQLLSEMEEAGDIEKLRIGRENLIALPDEDVTDIE